MGNQILMLTNKTNDTIRGNSISPFGEELGTGTTPEWFKKGVEAALLAPTAVNQQKFFFRYIPPKVSLSAEHRFENNSPHGDGVHRVKAERKFSLIGYTKMDLGIAKCHFEIGAGKENFKWE